MERRKNTRHKKKAADEGRIIGYQDETGIGLCPPKGSTYAPKGRTPVLKVHDTKGYAHLSVSAYINELGDMYYEIRECGFNGNAIVRFLENGFTGRKKKKHIVIWDGASIHKCKVVKDFLNREDKKQKRVWLEMLPPYSPELNPVELMWGYLKNTKLAGVVCRTLSELKKYVINAMEDIKKDAKLIQSFFKHKEVGFMQS